MELTFFRLRILLFLGFLLLSGQAPLGSLALKAGINYGRIADNLPPPTQVAGFLRSLGISRVKLYDADPNVLTAFANTNIELIIGLPNANLADMTNLNLAQSWIKQNVQPFLGQTKITGIVVGNEVLSGNDTALMANLLPAMESMYQALRSVGLSDQVTITTAHALAILGNSFPPSAGSFRQDIVSYIQPVLNFHAQINSPFLLNAYPFFAYRDSPGSVPLPYVLFKPNAGVTDPVTKLTYDNMLYAQIDSVYAAMMAMGHTDISVHISETGWPSKGDENETGATLENAGTYNRNLLKRVAMNQGTPLKPDVPLDVHIFALFNEDMKPRPTSERNYGLFYPDRRSVYSLQSHGTSSSSKLMMVTVILVLVLTTAFIV